MEGMKSNLMSLFEKKRLINVYKYVNGVNFDDKKTWGEFDIKTVPMKDIFEYYGLAENTIDFLGHAVALHYSDSFLFEPAYDTIKKMQLYL